jgi:hypothetical protein
MWLSEDQTKKLLEYQGKIMIKQLALSMTLTKFKRLYQAGAKPEVVSRCTVELNHIFEQSPANMRPDYEWITALCI